VPEGRALQKIEFYSNETRVATLYQAPWEQSINIRDTKGLGYVRVVGTLEDDCRRLHARYMRVRDALGELAHRRSDHPHTATDRAQARRAG
jgi:hypothetical protein